MFGEARGEGEEGLEAVAEVIHNRAKLRAAYEKRQIKSEDYHIVCLVDKQFSVWNKDDPNREILEELNIDDPSLDQCKHIATHVMNRGVTRGIVDTATHYHVVDQPPSSGWHLKLDYITDVGRHRFYHEPSLARSLLGL